MSSIASIRRNHLKIIIKVYISLVYFGFSLQQLTIICRNCYEFPANFSVFCQSLRISLQSMLKRIRRNKVIFEYDFQKTPSKRPSLILQWSIFQYSYKRHEFANNIYIWMNIQRNIQTRKVFVRDSQILTLEQKYVSYRCKKNTWIRRKKL